jgi:hypothetical protein
MKQTAVDWLIGQLYAPCRGIPSHIIEQAKEMEKEQMRLVHKNGYDNSQYRHDCNYGGVEYWDSVPKPFEEYYNETFNINDRHN